MDPTVQQWRFKEGDQVISADDHKLGKVIALVPDMLAPTHLVVEKGLLIKHDVQVPVSAVSNYAGGTIYLNATKDQVQSGAWEPVSSTMPETQPADEPW